MKKIFFVSASILMLASCAGYTDEQSKAADEFCACMDKDGLEDKFAFDIAWAECEMDLMTKHDPAVLTDDGWALALEEKCPATAGRIADGE